MRQDERAVLVSLSQSLQLVFSADLSSMTVKSFPRVLDLLMFPAIILPLKVLDHFCVVRWTLRLGLLFYHAQFVGQVAGCAR